MAGQDAFQKARGWFFDSGIQNQNGSFSAWFDLDTGKNSFEYSEVTGYGITALAFLNSIERDFASIERAKKAFEWLSAKALAGNGGVLARDYMQWEQPDSKFSFAGKNVFSFDCGMVLRGFLNLFKAGKEQKALDIALKIGSFLDENMISGGKMHAMYNLQSRECLDSMDKWSTQPGSYHAKIAIGLSELGRISGEARFGEAAIKLCENSLNWQLPEGRFVTNARDNSTHLHPHCYAAEGLLWVGSKLGEERFVDAAEKAVEWAFMHQAPDFGINAFFSGEWNQSQRSDVLAQALRLGSCLKSMGRLEPVDAEKLAGLEQRLLQFQRSDGGFLYGKELDLKERNCANAWCTMFALQALHWHDSFGRAEIDLEYLI